MPYIDLLKSQFNNRIDVRLKRPGIYQLIAPLFHEDGDMVDLFLESSPLGSEFTRISDHGMSLMRLSYTFDLNTPKKDEIFHNIICESQILEDNGTLYLDARNDELYPAVLLFAQVVAKVSSMRLYRREVIHSLFFEQLEEIVKTQLSAYDPVSPFYPIASQEEYSVDYCFNHSPRPVYLFGVDGPKAANLSTISCLKFANERIKFSSAIVLESLEKIGRKDLKRLMSAADKQFPSLEDFRENCEQYLEREIGR